MWGTTRCVDGVSGLDGVRLVAMDLKDEESVRRGYLDAEKESGGFDVVIQNAGYAVFGETEKMEGEQIAQQYQVMVFAPMQICRMALAGMRERGWGLMIGVTSLAGRFPIPYMGGYSAAKAAFGVQLSALRMELEGSGVRVVEVEPGDIRTDFHAATEHGAERGKRAQNVWARQLKDMAQAPGPEKVAKRILEIVEGRDRRDRVTVGDFFQSKIAPLCLRVFPRSWVEWGLNRYFSGFGT